MQQHAFPCLMTSVLCRPHLLPGEHGAGSTEQGAPVRLPLAGAGWRDPVPDARMSRLLMRLHQELRSPGLAGSSFTHGQRLRGRPWTRPERGGQSDPSDGRLRSLPHGAAYETCAGPWGPRSAGN